MRASCSSAEDASGFEEDDGGARAQRHNHVTGMPGPTPPQPATKPSSPTVALDYRGTATAGLDVRPALFYTTPTRCSTLGSSVHFGTNYVAVEFRCQEWCAEGCWWGWCVHAHRLSDPCPYMLAGYSWCTRSCSVDTTQRHISVQLGRLAKVAQSNQQKYEASTWRFEDLLAQTAATTRTLSKLRGPCSLEDDDPDPETFQLHGKGCVLRLTLLRSIVAPTATIIADGSLLSVATTPPAVLGRDKVVAAGALQAEADLAAMTPTRFSTLSWTLTPNCSVPHLPMKLLCVHPKLLLCSMECRVRWLTSYKSPRCSPMLEVCPYFLSFVWVLPPCR